MPRGGPAEPGGAWSSGTNPPLPLGTSGTLVVRGVEATALSLLAAAFLGTGILRLIWSSSPAELLLNWGCLNSHVVST